MFLLFELFKWLAVRDSLLGENKKQHDIAAALALARDCKHPDAEWLTSIFEGKDFLTKEKAREVFLLRTMLVLFVLLGGWARIVKRI